MGTRHLILVYYKGKYYIAQYGQWDGYPDGQGVVVLTFARDPSNLAKLQAAFDNDMVYTPTEAQLDEMEEESRKKQDERRKYLRELRLAGDMEKYDEESDRGEVLPYATLNRDTGAKTLHLVAEAKEPVPIVCDVKFITDTLFCQWAYVVDLDMRVLEVYAATVGSGERFKNIGGPGYIAKFALDNLPDEENFLRECAKTGGDDNDDDDDDVTPADEGEENAEGEEAAPAL
jgi:hypothetical protein